MNKNQITVKEYEIDKPDIHKVDFIGKKVIRDCHDKFFHTLENRCIYDTKITKIAKIQIVNFTIDDKGVDLYELKKH